MGSAHFGSVFLRKCTLKKRNVLYFLGTKHLISGQSPQVVKIKKTRSAAVISFQAVARLRSIHEGFGILCF